MQPIAIKKRKLGWPNNSGNKAIRKTRIEITLRWPLFSDCRDSAPFSGRVGAVQQRVFHLSEKI